MSQLALVHLSILQIKRKKKEKKNNIQNKRKEKEKKRNNNLADLPSHDISFLWQPPEEITVSGQCYWCI